MTFSFTKNEFILLVADMIGDDGIERTNRKYCQENGGFDPSALFHCGMLCNLAHEALKAHEYEDAHVDVNTKYEVQIHLDDEQGFHFKLRWL